MTLGQSFLSYITIFWRFFLNIINSLLTLITTVAAAGSVPPALMSSMWGPIGASVLVVTSFSVVKMLVGRSNV